MLVGLPVPVVQSSTRCRAAVLLMMLIAAAMQVRLWQTQ
jgi:hypothetical protein